MQIINLDAESFIESLKTLQMHYTCELDNNGEWVGSVKELQTLESAESPEALKSVLARALKEDAQAYISDFPRWKNGREWQIPFLLKVLTSTEGELMQCLHGRNLNAI
ncbi:MAG: hypothetical protein IJS99_03895 [Synergistaceae bacterium]|nr:hypothetical protein [Synergistaceae bacterium]